MSSYVPTLIDLYGRLCQTPPVGKLDLSKFRRLLSCLCLIEGTLNSELASYIFNRCLTVGERRLDADGFTKALVLFSAIVYPAEDPSIAWERFQDEHLVKFNYVSSARRSSFETACSCPDCEPPVRVQSPVRDMPMKVSSQLEPVKEDVYMSVEHMQSLLDSSEARSEQRPMSSARGMNTSEDHHDNVSMDTYMCKDERWEPHLVIIAERFESLLLEKFGDFEKAFRFMDNITLNKSGRISFLKFSEACEKLRFLADTKALFFFLDVNCDGYVDLDELRYWRGNHKKAVRIARNLIPKTMA